MSSVKANDNTLPPPKEGERKLTVKQEKFCQLYASDARFFGNATRAYIQAYKVDIEKPGAYGMARSAASENLTKPNINSRINQLLIDVGFDDVEVDKQLAFLIMQHADYKAKIAAIKEYNALKKRIVQKVEIGDMRETRDKIKDFLDEPTDYVGPAEQDAPSTESATETAETGGAEVAEPTQLIS